MEKRREWKVDEMKQKGGGCRDVGKERRGEESVGEERRGECSSDNRREERRV